MSRTSWVYLLAIVASAVGLWAILKFGSNLPAPPDVSGAWRIVPENPANAADPAIQRFGTDMHIDQSGRYLQVHFASGLALDLKAVDAPNAQPGVPTTLRATDGAWTLAFRPQKVQKPAAQGTPDTPPETELLVLVEKPQPYSFTAVRPANPTRTGPQ